MSPVPSRFGNRRSPLAGYCWREGDEMHSACGCGWTGPDSERARHSATHLRRPSRAVTERWGDPHADTDTTRQEATR